MFKRIITTALVFGMAATGPSSPAKAQIHCGPRPEVVRLLKQHHGETIIGIGIASLSAAYEVWRAQKTGSWTILMTRPSKVTCIIATGSSWMEHTKPPVPSTPAAKAAMQP